MKKIIKISHAAINARQLFKEGADDAFPEKQIAAHVACP